MADTGQKIREQHADTGGFTDLLVIQAPVLLRSGILRSAASMVAGRCPEQALAEVSILPRQHIGLSCPSELPAHTLLTGE